MENCGVWRPQCLRAEQSHSVMGNNVIHKLQRLLFKQMIVTDERVNMALMDLLVATTCFWILKSTAQPVLSSALMPDTHTSFLFHLPSAQPWDPHNPRCPKHPVLCVIIYIVVNHFTEERAEGGCGWGACWWVWGGGNPIYHSLYDFRAGQLPYSQPGCLLNGEASAPRDAHSCRGPTCDHTDMPFLPYDLGPGMRSTLPCRDCSHGCTCGQACPWLRGKHPQSRPPKAERQSHPKIENPQVSGGQSGLIRQTAIIQVLIFFN